MLTFGSLFAGIGGFDLGLERAGMRCLWQCELDPYAERVLARHWPDVLRVRDVRDVNASTVPAVDLVCGGFPCQDISVAGRGAGIDGEQSGLWAEMFRVVGDLRPRYVVVENVAALVTRGLTRVLGDLASIGYDAEWDCLRAADFGAPHLRARLWLVAYPSSARRRQDAGEGRTPADHYLTVGDGQGGRARAVAHTHGTSAHAHAAAGPSRAPVGERGSRTADLADADREPPLRTPVAWTQRHPWPAEPDVARMAHGVPDGLDRRTALGNSLIPQIAEWIGGRIIDYEQGQLRSLGERGDDA